MKHLVDSGYNKFVVETTAKKSIRIALADNADNASNVKVFEIGDLAEYDSWNHSYYGEILSITDKTVTIREKHTTKTRRLNLENFCWRNINFTVGKAQEQNFEAMMNC